MKNLKILIFSLIFLVGNYFVVLADITASSPTNMIQVIASTSSFTSLDQNSAQAQNITDNLLDSEQLQETVETGAETFGAQLNDAATEAAAEEEQFVTLNDEKIGEGIREFPEPNLDTIVYDTGFMTLTESTDPQYNGGAEAFFEGTQKARVKVYIDFVRQKLWGSTESHITLKVAKDPNNNNQKMVNVFEGGAMTVTKLPVSAELIHTISSATAKPLRIDNNIMPEFGNEESPFDFDPHSITSLLQDKTTPTLAEYEIFGFPDVDLADMQKSVSHGSGGDKNVLVTTKFKTGASGAVGTATAGFEISNAPACGSASRCSDSEIEAIKTSIIRLDATGTSSGKKYTGE